MRARRNKQEPNYWAAYADCMLALFMIALLLWLLSSGKTIFSSAAEKGDLTTVIVDLRAQVKKLQEEVARKEEQIADFRKTVEALPDGKRLAELVKENETLRKENDTLQTQLADSVAARELLEKRNEELAKRNEELSAED